MIELTPEILNAIGDNIVFPICATVGATYFFKYIFGG